MWKSHFIGGKKPIHSPFFHWKNLFFFCSPYLVEYFNKMNSVFFLLFSGMRYFIIIILAWKIVFSPGQKRKPASCILDIIINFPLHILFSLSWNSSGLLFEAIFIVSFHFQRFFHLLNGTKWFFFLCQVFP